MKVTKLSDGVHMFAKDQVTSCHVKSLSLVVSKQCPNTELMYCMGVIIYHSSFLLD